MIKSISQIRDGQLFVQVVALVCLDVAVLLIWEVVDPMKIQKVKGYPVVSIALLYPEITVVSHGHRNHVR